MKYLLRWLIAWASLLDGIVGVLTLGFYQPSWQLEMARLYSRIAYRRGWLKNIGGN